VKYNADGDGRNDDLSDELPECQPHLRRQFSFGRAIAHYFGPLSSQIEFGHVAARLGLILRQFGA
jgi:hypothetical protein